MKDKQTPDVPKAQRLPVALDPLTYHIRPGLGRLEATGIAILFGILVLFALDYLLLGLQGTAHLYFEARRLAIHFLLWKAEMYVIPGILGLFFTAWMIRNIAPYIEIPILGASGDDVKTHTRWYVPRSLHDDGENLTWREGKYRASINKRFVVKRGWTWGLLVIQAVERNVNIPQRTITYDTTDIEAYRSQTLSNRLQTEVQLRLMAERQLARMRWEK